MNAKTVSLFNRRVEALYRAVYLHETLDAIAHVVGLHGRQGVRRMLNTAERDDRVLRAVAMRASAEERKLNALFEDGYRAQS